MADKVRTAVAVIPARYGSQRLPGKPLLQESGRYLIQHVYERVRQARLVSRIIVATDDLRIADAVLSFGGEAMMTSPDCASGTDRVAEVGRRLPEERFINVQGDEPDIEPAFIDALVPLLHEAEMATIAVPLDPSEADLPNRVKVVLDRSGCALYFSRSRIPHSANGSAKLLLHLGIYGYTKSCLARLASLPPSPLERSEKLEQLRALENGIRIRVAVLQAKSPGGIDTREDYEAFLKRTRGR